MSEQTPNYNLRRAAVASGAIIGVVGGASLIGQAVENGTKEEQRIETITTAFEEHEEFLKETVEQATNWADPLDIQDTFTINGNEALIDLGESIVVNLDGYEENKNLIDYTMLQSALAQGSYDVNDTFAVTSAEIGGRDTYIIQPVHQEPDASINPGNPKESTD